MLKKLLIPLTVLLSLPLFADQASRRLERPWQITVFPALRPYATISRNLGENFSVGLSIASGGRSESPEIVTSTGFGDCNVPDFLNLSLCQKSVSRNPSGFLFLNYYPFDTSLFLGAFAGRSGGEARRFTEYASFRIPTLELSSQAPVVYTVTEEAHYFAGPGAGLRHVFSGGPVLALEAWLGALSPHQNRAYVSHDLRSLSSSYAPLSPTDMLLSQSWLQNASSPPTHVLNLLLHFGFAF